MHPVYFLSVLILMMSHCDQQSSFQTAFVSALHPGKLSKINTEDKHVKDNFVKTKAVETSSKAKSNIQLKQKQQKRAADHAKETLVTNSAKRQEVDKTSFLDDDEIETEDLDTESTNAVVTSSKLDAPAEAKVKATLTATNSADSKSSLKVVSEKKLNKVPTQFSAHHFLKNDATKMKSSPKQLEDKAATQIKYAEQYSNPSPTAYNPSMVENKDQYVMAVSHHEQWWNAGWTQNRTAIANTGILLTILVPLLFLIFLFCVVMPDGMYGPQKGRGDVPNYVPNQSRQSPRYHQRYSNYDN